LNLPEDLPSFRTNHRNMFWSSHSTAQTNLLTAKRRSLRMMQVFLAFLGLLVACSNRPPQVPPISPNALKFYEKHPNYLFKSITQRRFKLEDIEPTIKALPAPFRVNLAGQSFQKRNIYHVNIGNGPVKVLLWSQMHGDEPTATMAMMDIFNFFQQKDEFDPLRQEILSKLSLHFIPMLNPDGANRFTRRSMQGIDINRDALRLQTPEARILKKVRDEVKADWGFNLHDQNIYLGAGRGPHPASISFLAPAFDYEKSINDVRGDAMKLIGLMNQVLQTRIPNQVGRYDDAFEPRAFGDNMQKWGTRTILIETGGLKGDSENQELRRLNFTIFMSALEGIANQVYQKWDFSGYDSLPENESNSFHDMILRKVQITRNDKLYTVDLAFRRTEVEAPAPNKYFYKSTISELGDLSTSHAYEEHNLEGYQAVPGKILSGVYPSGQNIGPTEIKDFHSRGITDIQRTGWAESMEQSKFPLLFIRPKDNSADPGQSGVIGLGVNTSLLIQKDGVTEYVVVNGFLHKI
jgi:Zinc carboxypeptidase